MFGETDGSPLASLPVVQDLIVGRQVAGGHIDKRERTEPGVGAVDADVTRTPELRQSAVRMAIKARTAMMRGVTEMKVGDKKIPGEGHDGSCKQTRMGEALRTRRVSWLFGLFAGDGAWAGGSFMMRQILPGISFVAREPLFAKQI
jgi:hypothetical protein